MYQVRSRSKIDSYTCSASTLTLSHPMHTHLEHPHQSRPPPHRVHDSVAERRDWNSGSVARRLHSAFPCVLHHPEPPRSISCETSPDEDGKSTVADKWGDKTLMRSSPPALDPRVRSVRSDVAERTTRPLTLCMTLRRHNEHTCA